MAVSDLPSNPQAVAPLRVYTLNSAGAIVSPSGGGTEFAEDTAHASGDLGTLALAVRRTADTSLVDATGDYAPLQVDDSGYLKVNVKASTAAGGIVDNAGFTDGTTVVTLIAGVLDETPGTALTENDAAAVRIDSKRAIVNVIEDATTRGQRWAINAAGSAQVQGQVASDGVAAGNPVLGGARASTAAPSAVSADGDAVALWASRLGALQVAIRDINAVDAFGEVQTTPTQNTLLGRLKDLVSTGTPYANVLKPVAQTLGNSSDASQYVSDTTGWNKLVLTLGGFASNNTECVGVSWSTTVSDTATCKTGVDAVTTLSTGKWATPDGSLLLNTAILAGVPGATFEIEIDPTTPVKSYGVGASGAAGIAGARVSVVGLRAA